MKEIDQQVAASEWEGFGWDTPTTPTIYEGKKFDERQEWVKKSQILDFNLELTADNEGMLDRRGSNELIKSIPQNINSGS